MGLVLRSAQKLTLVTITLEIVPFCTYAPFPVLLPFFKCILEVVFCEGVQHHLWFCLNHLNCTKVAGNREKLQRAKSGE
jgi:hypothetical protein